MNTERMEFFRATGLVLVWAAVMVLLMVIALNRLNLAPDTAYNWMSPDRLNVERQFFPLFAQWDGDWYIRLATEGYVFDPNGLSNVAFLPLYPLLLRLVVFVTQSYITAAWVINGISLVGALYFFQKLAREEGLTEEEGNTATAFLLVYPTVIFYFAVYTEALFLFLSIATVYFAKKQRYPIAGLFGMAAALTRIPGLFLLIPFVYFLWKKRASFMQYTWLMLLPIGTAIYIGLQKWYTGHALAFLIAQKNWGRSFFSLNGDHVAFVSEASVTNFALDLFFAFLLLAGVVLVIKKLHVGYGLYVLVACIIPLLTGTLMSMGRFGMVLFPYYLALAKVQNPWPKRAWLFVSTALLMLYTIQFVHGYWAG